jgi:hypothetical protein
MVGGAWTLVSAQQRGAKAGSSEVGPGGVAPAGTGNFGGGGFGFGARAGFGSAPVPGNPGDAFYYSPVGANGAGVIAVDDPEAAKLAQAEAEVAQEAEQLSGKYESADKPDEQKRIRAELREVLAKQFNVQHQRRELELTRIEERVQKLRDQIKKRNEARESIIDRRLEQLINEAEGLGWSSAPGSPAGLRAVKPAPGAAVPAGPGAGGPSPTPRPR